MIDVLASFRFVSFRFDSIDNEGGFFLFIRLVIRDLRRQRGRMDGRTDGRTGGEGG